MDQQLPGANKDKKSLLLSLVLTLAYSSHTVVSGQSLSIGEDYAAWYYESLPGSFSRHWCIKERFHGFCHNSVIVFHSFTGTAPPKKSAPNPKRADRREPLFRHLWAAEPGFKKFTLKTKWFYLDFYLTVSSSWQRLPGRFIISFLAEWDWKD